MALPKILVVDDDEKILYAFRELLAKEGYQCLEAVNGTQALKRLTAEMISAVFLDIGLPDQDGLKILQQIRRYDRDVPVIIITSLGSDEILLRARELGATDYLQKPLSLAAIRKILREIKTTKQFPFAINKKESAPSIKKKRPPIKPK